MYAVLVWTEVLIPKAFQILVDPSQVATMLVDLWDLYRQPIEGSKCKMRVYVRIRLLDHLLSALGYRIGASNPNESRQSEHLITNDVVVLNLQQMVPEQYFGISRTSTRIDYNSPKDRINTVQDKSTVPDLEFLTFQISDPVCIQATSGHIL